MILSDDEASARLVSPSNLSNQLVEIRKMKEGGKKLGQVAVPLALRSLLGSLAVQGNENQSDIAKAFGVSQPSVSAYSRGLVGDRLDQDLMHNRIETEESVAVTTKANIDTAHQAALDVMMLSLSGLTNKMQDPEEAALLKPKELSRIATDMSKIVSVATGQDKDKNSVINNTKVIVYAPQQRKEDSYDFIDA
tara:strand:- start:628 stop:1206 length:579 start_codon:yes stop_codon:yes gene_type:complete